MNKTIAEIVRSAETNYQIGTTQLGEHVSFSLRETLERIIAYLNSKHISGDQDSMGRDKPFFNIVTAAVNIWYRATDLDRKDIIIRPGKESETMAAFMATMVLRDWMNRTNFGLFLNRWGRTLSQYGSAVTKFVVQDGILIPSVIPWNRMVVDAVDFDALPRIEKIYKTPEQLMKMKEIDKETAKGLLNSLTTRKSTTNKTQKDNIADFIEIYEVHGELPIALLLDDINEAEDSDWETYRQQMHLISYVKNAYGKYDDFTLYRGKEEKDPYILTHLIEEEGRVLSIGAVEYLFDSQWMSNHSVKNMKDTLDLASKLIFQTADSNFLGRNILSAIETGDILITANNRPLTQVNTYKADIVALQNYAGMWKLNAQELSATPDAMRGITPPSGTPYSSMALMTQQSNSLFEIMVESKGLHLEDMLRKHIIPYLKTKLNNKDEIVSVLTDSEIQMIDSRYIPNKAIQNYNKKNIEKVLNGEQAEPFDKETGEMEVKQSLSGMGNQRFFSPKDIEWKEVFKDLEWTAEVGITNEPADKQAVLTTLSTVLQSIASNPNILQDPNSRFILGKILSFTGAVSPVELSTMTTQPVQPTQPQPTPDLQALAGKKVV